MAGTIYDIRQPLKPSSFSLWLQSTLPHQPLLSNLIVLLWIFDLYSLTWLWLFLNILGPRFLFTVLPQSDLESNWKDQNVFFLKLYLFWVKASFSCHFLASVVHGKKNQTQFFTWSLQYNLPLCSMWRSDTLPWK